MFGYVNIGGKQSCPFSRQDMQVLLLVCRWRICPFLTAQISCWQLLWWWRPWPSFPPSHLSDPTVSRARRGSRWIPLLRPDFTATCRLSGHSGVPIVAQWVKNPADILEDAGLIPGLAQWGWGSGIAVSCGVGYRLGLDPTHIAVAVVKANSCSSSSTPSLGTSICLRRSHKKKKKIGHSKESLEYTFLTGMPGAQRLHEDGPMLSRFYLWKVFGPMTLLGYGQKK